MTRKRNAVEDLVAALAEKDANLVGDMERVLDGDVALKPR